MRIRPKYHDIKLWCVSNLLGQLHDLPTDEIENGVYLIEAYINSKQFFQHPLITTDQHDEVILVDQYTDSLWNSIWKDADGDIIEWEECNECGFEGFVGEFDERFDCEGCQKIAV